MIYFVYETTNLINGKKYIGKHKGSIDDDYLGSDNLIISAIKKYGKKNFKREILYIAKNEQDAYDKEKYYISLFNAVNNDNYYNISEGQNLNSTCINKLDRSYTKEKEYREKMSSAVSGEKNGMYGKHHTEESKQKMSNSHKGIASGEKNGMYGKHHTEESKQRMSQNHKGITSGDKNGMYGKTGDKALNGKKVGMYDKDGKLIRIFNARSAVNEFFNLKGNSNSHLCDAIKYGTLYKGYYWKNI